MERIIADDKVVVMMIAFAALVYFTAYSFMKPRPAQSASKKIRAIVVLLLGFATGWLLYMLHVSSYVIIAIAVIAVVVGAFLERKKVRPVT